MVRYVGGCHCRNVTYVLDWPVRGPLPLRTCSCAFCTKQSAIYLGHPDGRLRVSVGDASRLSAYKFSTHTAEFRSCQSCGVFLFAVCPIDGEDHAVLNVHTIENFTIPKVVERRDHDGEAVEGRLDRRRETWIGQVEWVVATSAPDAGESDGDKRH